MSRLDVRAATRRYGGVRALDAVTLRVEQGTRAAIVGASGSGKTTLLRAVAGFERLDAGCIALDAQTVADAGANVHVPAHRRGIGIVSQHGALFPHLDVARNIGFGLPRALRGSARAARVASLMETVELDGALAARRPHALSGGQQQRVALARALARDPRVMLLDEPFSSLDTELRESVRRSIGAVLAATGVTSVLVTHDRAEALGFADHVAVMRDGAIVQAGEPAALYARPVDRQTALLLGDALVLRAALSDDVADCALGAVRLGTGGHSGVGEIMLRSEQLSLVPAGDATRHGIASSPPPEGVEGRVVGREFTGPACIATVALSGRGGQLSSVRVRMPSAEAVGAGEAVRVLVRGSAHVFAASAA